jgi:hypothetical protein
MEEENSCHFANSALQLCKLILLSSLTLTLNLALPCFFLHNLIIDSQVHALQRMEEENSWVRRPPNLMKDPLPKTLARFAWISFFMLLPLLRLLPGMKRAVHASLFQTIMSTTIPYDRLQTAIRLAPFVWAGLLAGLVAGVKQLVRVGLGMLA